jgi:hypothetical protein
MKRLWTLGTVAGFLMAMASICLAATNLNSSRSNIYRLTYPADLASVEQAKALLADLDKLGPAGEAKLKKWLPGNFRRYGIEATRVRKIVILPKGKEVKETAIILLTDPADEAEARATTVKSSKSNSSE